MNQTQKSNPLAGLISLAVLGFIGYQVYSCNNSGASSSYSSVEKSQPLYHISAKDLFDMYERNEVSADAAMKGDTVVVTGTVQAIDKNFEDAVVVELATSNEYAPVRMTLISGQEGKASALSKGEIVTIS
jgi:predicted negative regulator of RcsB-dependent stress response